MDIKTVVNILLDRIFDFTVEDSMLYLVMGNKEYHLHIFDEKSLAELYDELMNW